MTLLQYTISKLQNYFRFEPAANLNVRTRKNEDYRSQPEETVTVLERNKSYHGSFRQSSKDWGTFLNFE